MNKGIRIVIADDHPIFRSGLAQLLKTEEHINIVGEAANGEKALAIIRETLPDVVILDIDMPEKGGFEVAEELVAAQIPAEIIFLTMHKNETLFNCPQRQRDGRHHRGGQNGQGGRKFYQPDAFRLFAQTRFGRYKVNRNKFDRTADAQRKPDFIAHQRI
jgi:CheY-like chemotaxis protein